MAQLKITIDDNVARYIHAVVNNDRRLVTQVLAEAWCKLRLGSDIYEGGSAKYRFDPNELSKELNAIINELSHGTPYRGWR